MMEALLEKVKRKNIRILNNINVTSFLENKSYVEIVTENFSYKSSKLFIATNGFSNKLLNENIIPARAQVLITKPIKNLQIEGTFHFDRGYYYFRNIDNRILLGGGRNLDFKKEETDNFGLNDNIQSELESVLKNIVLPKKEFEIDYRWSGIMGVGTKKTTIVKSISENVFCGIRLGGMGVAIGSSVGNELANKI
jgi:gamma-glutamylputrescine oxidase